MIRSHTSAPSLSPFRRICSTISRAFAVAFYVRRICSLAGASKCSAATDVGCARGALTATTCGRFEHGPTGSFKRSKAAQKFILVLRSPGFDEREVRHLADLTNGPYKLRSALLSGRRVRLA